MADSTTIPSGLRSADLPAQMARGAKKPVPAPAIWSAPAKPRLTKIVPVRPVPGNSVRVRRQAARCKSRAYSCWPTPKMFPHSSPSLPRLRSVAPAALPSA